MNKKLSLYLLILLCLLTTGCSAVFGLPQEVINAGKKYLIGSDNSSVTYIIILENDSGEIVTRVPRAKININNYRVNNKIECPIELTNLIDESTTVILELIHIEKPTATTSLQTDNTTIDFVWLPSEQWVTIGDAEIELLPNETKYTTITLEVPKNVELPNRWEFRVRARPLQHGNIQPSVGIRFLVSMRQK